MHKIITKLHRYSSGKALRIYIAALLQQKTMVRTRVCDNARLVLNHLIQGCSTFIAEGPHAVCE